MPADTLTEQETETLRFIYQRDVRYWSSWTLAIRFAKQKGKSPLGLHWVILPYKNTPEIPPLRQQMNAIYFECLSKMAEVYCLKVTINIQDHKVYLYDPNQVDAEWLIDCETHNERIAA